MEQFMYDRDSEAEIYIFSVVQLNAEMVGQVIAASPRKVKHPYLSRACKACRGSYLLRSFKLSYPSRAVQAKVGSFLREEEMLFHSIHP